MRIDLRLRWLYYYRPLGGRTSYHKLAGGFDATRFGFRLFPSLWNLTGTSAATFQSDTIIMTSNLSKLLASRLHEKNTPARLGNRGPEWLLQNRTSVVRNESQTQISRNTVCSLHVLSCQIFFKFYTEHDSITTVLFVNLQNDLTEMDVVTDLVKFEFAYCPFSKCITDRSNTKTGLFIPNRLSMYKSMT